MKTNWIGLGTIIKWWIRPFVWAFDKVACSDYLHCEKCERRRQRLDAKFPKVIPYPSKE